MTDTTSHGGTGPSHRGVEMGVAVAMVAFGAIVIYGSLQVGIGWGAGGTEGRILPVLSRRHDHPGERDESPRRRCRNPGRRSSPTGRSFGSVISVVIPTTIYVFAVPWAGIYLSSLILIALFMRWLGRYGIAMCAAVSIGVVVVTYLMFEKWFLVPLPKGPIEDWLGL